MNRDAGHDAHDCGECAMHDALAAPAAMQRREFLRQAMLVAASLGVAGAARPAQAFALPGVARALAAGARDARAEKRYAIPLADGVAIDHENSVIVARAGNKVYAFSLACPHQNTALRWSAEDKEFRCPKHKSHYRPDGAFIEGRATRDMDRMAVRRDGAVLVVDVDLLYQADEHPAEWAAAVVSV